MKATLKNNPYIQMEDLEMLHGDAFGWAKSCCNYQKEEAKEVVQIAYMRILSGKAQFKIQQASLKTWLFGVIFNIAREQRKKNKRNQIGFFDHFNLKNENSDNLPQNSEEIAFDQEQNKEIYQAIKSLSQRQQEIIELVFYRDLTIEEAAQVTHLSVGTARTHYARAKSELSKILKDTRITHE